jgi:hypothetical protein
MNDTGARFAASALGALFAETITLPTDVAKVRLQVQQSAVSPKYNGLVDCLAKIRREEGVTALWKGLTPALTRQVCYTSLSFVIYEPIRDLYKGILQGGDTSVPPNFGVRLIAGGSAGSVAIAIFNPTEVVKTQVQTHTGADRLGMMAVVRKVWATDGILGFWAGVKPNVARTFLVNAAELGTYDEAKHRLQAYVESPLLSHVAASGCAGFSSACISTPVDVIKTRLMNAAGGAKQYSGIVDAGCQILKQEGPLALYKGFWPICVRKLIWCASFFVSFEQIRAAINQRTSNF